MLNPTKPGQKTMAKLHALDEGGKKPRLQSVYSCPACDRVLQVRRKMGPAETSAATTSGTCAGCGSLLKGGTERTSASVLAEQSDHVATRLAERGGGALFQRASAMPHFSLGFPKLDSLLRPMSSGDLVVFGGAPSSAVAELATFRAQLPIELGGLDSAVIYIDGGNRSDPYLFSSFAKQKNLEPAAAMRRVISCRVFTIYQLASLVSEHLSRAIEDYGARLVILADLLGTFNEPELEESEARRVLAAIEEGVRDIKKHALVVATTPSPNRYDNTVSAWGDTSVRLTSEAGGVKAELTKQRGRQPRMAAFKQARLLRAARMGALR